MPGSFRCKVRADQLPVAGLKVRWSRRASRAAWVHDSLVVASGFWLVRVHALTVHFAEGAVETAPVGAVRGLGANPVMLSLQLDGGGQALLAAPRTARGRVAGPYLVAQLISRNDQPDARATTDTGL
jgi:hypothetical protein